MTIIPFYIISSCFTCFFFHPFLGLSRCDHERTYILIIQRNLHARTQAS
uniref:Uncharacterized protein n=1 Tax=Rhizophora mucronata TaxID=61149 RepID=A0A2P2PGH2_RHIMU